MIQNFINNAKGLTRNPLGIIALFISLIYGFACLVLSTSISNLNGSIERQPLIWFIIGFPILILLSFIYLVVNHHAKLYAPIDYKDEKNFMSTLSGGEFRMFKEARIDVTADTEKNKEAFNQLVKKAENPNFNKVLFPEKARPNLNLANSFLDHLRVLTEPLVKKQEISGFGFGIQAPEYFLISYVVPEKFLKQKGRDFRDTVIIRVTENENEELTLIAIGKDIQEKSSKNFAEKFKLYIDDVLERVLEKPE
jgi:hypothetical protein